MKKITILAVLLLSVSIMASAQKKARQNASNYLRKGNLEQAKINIDKASIHEQTMNDAKTWFYYGNTYIRIATDTASMHLDADALDKAYKGYMKCRELDTKNRHKVLTLQDLVVISNNYYTRGAKLYEARDFAGAYPQFLKASEVNESIDIVDTLFIYAAAMSAQEAKMYEEAVVSYEKLIAMDYNKPVIYSDLFHVNNAKGDTVAAKDVVERGLIKYPTNPTLLINKINILLGEQNFEEVIIFLDEGIKIDPENASLYHAQGQSFEKMNKMEKATAAYKKAIEKNPNHTDALFNLGAISYNKAVAIYEKANELPIDGPQADYDEMVAGANIFFLEAQPYFEKAFELLPGDRNLINSLNQIYTKTNQEDKIPNLK